MVVSFVTHPNLDDCNKKKSEVSVIRFKLYWSICNVDPLRNTIYIQKQIF